jgi:hypothetical protein
MIRELVSREALDVDEVGYWRRMPLVVGVAFGGLMALFALLMPLGPPIEGSMRAVRALAIGLSSGLIFALLFPRQFRRSVRRLLDKRYAGVAPFDAPPPAGMALDYRLPASLQDRGGGLVSGVLYLGPEDVVFVPHARGRTPSVVHVCHPRHAGPTARRARVNRLQRVFLERAPIVVELGQAGMRRAFLVPDPAFTVPRLEEILGT